ncbi:uncharacterized protein KGF55_005053 [Candida pseudojiufengensis]|uniref:uncharacterized protein n=1 Tax=Candida pseudojiufengensis TaxID=497109 RepID=UPI002224B031|nr:uncharacterized protein KGF55_005053 [Candida pseudojiufengensis]KAI5959821.1 hypothetical protein KGF55_005053 [Candida pseudojiufengensis]
MTSLSTSSSRSESHQHHKSLKPQNLQNPIRLAFLGGSKSGKTTIISKLTLGSYRETYYPTNQITPILFNYVPESIQAKEILINSNLEVGHNINLSHILKNKKNVGSFVKNNQYYHINESKDEITPILVELIDTPSFNPQKVVPYLEESLYTNLDKEILHNLANEPRRPVSTNPLLVASGASELNGNVNGYFFVYSAIPSYNPPSYETQANELPNNHTFKLLPTIKDALNDAWEEYNTFKRDWAKGEESDIFSFKFAFKNILNSGKSKSTELIDQLYENSSNSPPIWIICTQSKNELASSQLIEDGKKLSNQWKCGFVAIDNVHDDVDIILSLMIRDILQKQKLK